MTPSTHMKRMYYRSANTSKDLRMIVHPSNDLQVNCYADVDLDGLYGVEDHQDTTSVKSRT
eukprot:522115-Ditylum_brightwellii.AAC.1